MRHEICAGTMLIEDDAPLPESMEIATERYLAGWSFVTKVTGVQLGREIEKAGWTFFYMAGAGHESRFGFSAQSGMDRAMAQAIETVERSSCNCLEIVDTRRRSFLGLWYVNITTRARHIQKSSSFTVLSNAPAKIQSRPQEWLYNRILPVRGSALLAGEALQSWENEGGTH